MQQIELTVKQLNMYVRSLLEGDVNLASVNLVGELSNFKDHYSSGHWYFVLKDRDAAVRGVMFKGNALRVDFKPADGMTVVCRGYVSLYEKDGQFQFYAESMRPFGKGDLAAEFERVKAKLMAEGLFDEDRKKPLPQFPKKIGVITSKSGAALQDILNILSRRYPLCNVVLFPATVQGDAAPESLINALNEAYKYSYLDTIIIGRGGGSAEDLACFNSEELARVISLSKIPIISAVGHETDFTICDFVADLRAPTPSAAAELSTPFIDDIILKINLNQKRLLNGLAKYIREAELKLQHLSSRRFFENPELIFAPFEIGLDKAVDKLEKGYFLKLKENEARVTTLREKLIALSPQNTLNRGFSVTLKDGEIIKNWADVSVSDKISLKLAKGELKCTVNEILAEE